VQVSNDAMYQTGQCH